MYLSETHLWKDPVQDFSVGGTRCWYVQPQHKQDLCFVFIRYLLLQLAFQSRFPIFPFLPPSEQLWLAVWGHLRRSRHALGALCLISCSVLPPSRSPIPLWHLLAAASDDSCPCLPSREAVATFPVPRPPPHTGFLVSFCREEAPRTQDADLLVVGGGGVLA